MDTYYVTIDDGPYDDFEMRCEFLESQGIRAIWYCQGDRLDYCNEAVIRAIRFGHIIGNHGYSHRRFSEMSYEDGYVEITKTDAMIDNLYHQAGCPRMVRTFRFPFLDTGDGATYENWDLNHWKVKKYQKLLYELGYRVPDFRGEIPESYGKYGLNALISVDLTYDSRDWAIGHILEDQKKITEDDVLNNLKEFCYKNQVDSCRNTYEIILMHSFTSFETFKLMIQIVLDHNRHIDCPTGMKTHHLMPIERGDSHHLEKHQWIMAQSDKKELDVIFIGDSLTRRWEDYPGVFQTFFGSYNCVNFGVGGDNTNNLMWRLEAGELRGIAPRVIVLLIGTNNLHLNSVDEIHEAIEKLISIINEECPLSCILLHGLLPRLADDVMTDYMEKISSLNQKIQYELPFLCFFVPSDPLSTGFDFLEFMPDGLHLNEEGYKQWGAYLEPIIKNFIDYGGNLDEVREL